MSNVKDVKAPAQPLPRYHQCAPHRTSKPVFTPGKPTVYSVETKEFEALAEIYGLPEMDDATDDHVWVFRDLFFDEDFLAEFDEYMLACYPEARRTDLVWVAFEALTCVRWAIFDGTNWKVLNEYEGQEGTCILPKEFGYPTYPLDYWRFPDGPFEGGNVVYVTVTIPDDAKLTVSSPLKKEGIENTITYEWPDHPTLCFSWFDQSRIRIHRWKLVNAEPLTVRELEDEVMKAPFVAVYDRGTLDVYLRNN